MLVSTLVALTLAAAAPSSATGSAACLDTPDPAHFVWGPNVNEEAWVWEVPGSTSIVWLLPGGSWKQEPGGFEPAQMNPDLATLYSAGISVGQSGYGTDELFPAPEVALELLVLHSRAVLGYDDVTLLGRSTGSYMATFNVVVAQGPAAADRACLISMPLAFLPVYHPFSATGGLAHFWPGANQLLDIPDAWELVASAAYWPLVFPADQARRIGVVGMPKPLEAPLLPLPIGTFNFGPESHSAWNAELLALTLQAAGWTIDFEDSYNGGQVLEPSAVAVAWLLAELGA